MPDRRSHGVPALRPGQGDRGDLVVDRELDRTRRQLDLAAGHRNSPGKLSLLTPGLASASGSAAATAQRNSGLSQYAMDETVRPAGRRGQRADALASAVPLLQFRRQLSAIDTSYPGALLESFGHAFLPVNSGRRCAAVSRHDHA